MKKLFWCILISVSCNFFPGVTLALKKVSDVKTNTLTPQIIKSHGYLCESHVIKTDDGYFLTAHRVPHGKMRSSRPKKGVVILQHGILASSADWTLLGPENSLPYILANNDYDVWLGNARGNSYSKKHANLSVHSKEFWDFSWHEMGIYDLPAVIDYVLNITNRDKLFFVGHSVGSSMFFVMASLKPEYARKVEIMYALAPVAYMKHMDTNLIKKAGKYLLVKIWAAVAEKDEFTMKCDEDEEFLSNFRNRGFLWPYIQTLLCVKTFFFIIGNDNGQFDEAILPILVKLMPDGTSSKALRHFRQVHFFGRFGQYDYLSDYRNYVKYKSFEPPVYNLSAIETPVNIFYGDKDHFANEKDIDRLCRELQESCVGKYLVNYKGFNHLDFMWGKDAPTLIYGKILENLDIISKRFVK